MSPRSSSALFLCYCSTVVSASAIDAILDTATRAGRAAAGVITTKLGAEVIKTKAGARDLLTAVDTECLSLIHI